MGQPSQDLILGDCVDVMSHMFNNTVDAVVCDPPYGLEFMGKEWDKLGRQNALRGKTSSIGLEGKPGFDLSLDAQKEMQRWHEAWAEEALRVLKPGGHLLAFGGTRTYHRLAAGLEDAGFEIRDCLMWVQGQGFPKSLNLEGGLGTALKPSFEPIVLARKPFKGTVADNVTRYGTGALNIDTTRIGTSKNVPASVSRHAARDDGVYDGNRDGSWGNERGGPGSGHDPDTGRWPANVVLSHTDECIPRGNRTVEGRQIRRPPRMLPFGGGVGLEYAVTQFPDESVEVWDCVPGCPIGDLGEAARYYYQAKVSVSERTAGLDDSHVSHPTVKPIDLMRWLCRLVTSQGGVVLDPFTGSGSTGIAALLEGFSFIGIEQSLDYLNIARARLMWWGEHGPDGLRIVAERDAKLKEATKRREELKQMGQMDLFT